MPDFLHDVRTQEFAGLKLNLRRDLRCTPQLAADPPYLILEDPLQSRFFRIGVREYGFISLLDSETTVGEALAICARTMPQESLSESEAASVCHWLLQNRLAATPATGDESLREQQATAEATRRLAKFNPLAMRFPLCRPDQFFRAILPATRWLFNGWAVAAWFLTLVLAAVLLAPETHRIASSARGIFARENWMWLGLCWLLLKLLHETAHGIACTRNGGQVREAGVMLVFLAPVAYVDISSAWQFRSRWQRVQTAAAGMYAELFVAAAAACAWTQLESGWLAYLCFNVMFMASVSTLLMNANPLMRFDGYFLLADSWGIANLSVRARDELRRLATWLLLGQQPSRSLFSARTVWLLRLYGTGAILWRLAISCSLTLAVATLFHGAGVALLALAAIGWAAVSWSRVQEGWRAFNGLPLAARRRGMIRTAAIATAVIIILLLPWPAPHQAPAIVDYAPLTLVRVASPGFVQQLGVQTNQQVEAGDLLAILDNPALAHELADLELQIAKARLQCRRLEQEHKLAELQAEQKRVESLLTMQSEKQQQVDRLVIRAPRAGRVLARNLSTRLGAYLEEGTELVAIGQESAKEIVASVSQDDMQAFARRVGGTVTIDSWDVPPLSGVLQDLAPSASSRPPHVALCAPYGGPLATVPRDQSDSTHASAGEFELLHPRFVATIGLNADQSQRLYAGQQVVASSYLGHESIGGHLGRRGYRWFEDRLQFFAQRSETR